MFAYKFLLEFPLTFRNKFHVSSNYNSLIDFTNNLMLVWRLLGK